MYLLWWISKGSQPQKRMDRLRNDLIDIEFAVYGTYYEGLITGDQKAYWIYHRLAGALSMRGADAP